MDTPPVPAHASDEDAADLERLGVYDPSSPDAAERLSLLRQALALGASREELASSSLVELILDLRLRPRLELTVGHAVEGAGLAWVDAERLLSALGLPTDRDARVSGDELGAIRLLAGAVELLGMDATTQVARAAGGAMARVAEALVTAFRLRVELPHRDAGADSEDISRESSEFAERVLPDFVQALGAALRHQIIRVAEPMWSTDPERSAVVLPRAIGFADIVGYTTAASELSARELTAVLMEFDEATSAAVVAAGGQIVKMIGDEAMFVTADPASACDIGLSLTSTFGRGSLPPVRVGLASGEVVSVFGDVYGPVVNLAARLVAVAEPSTVLVSESIYQACESAFRFDWLGALDLKGIGQPVRVARMQARNSTGH